MQYYLKRLVAWIYFLFLRTTLYKLEGYHRKLKEYVFNFRNEPIKSIRSSWYSIFYKRDSKKRFTKELKDPTL